MHRAFDDSEMAGKPTLIVEDDVLLARSVARILSAHGHVAETIPGVEAARTAMLRNEYAAWIIDVQLPDGSGIGLLAWARGEGLRTPALVITGGTDRFAANAILLFGGEFAFKPVTQAQLEAFMVRATHAARPHESVPEVARSYAALTALSPRETDLVVARASGVQHDMLPAHLGISQNTVKTMIRSIKRKTGVENLDGLLNVILRRHAEVAEPKEPPKDPPAG